MVQRDICNILLLFCIARAARSIGARARATVSNCDIEDELTGLCKAVNLVGIRSEAAVRQPYRF